MINDFVFWYFDEFNRSTLYEDMANLAENSPWHREHSIGAHTDMVVVEYLRNIKTRESSLSNNICGAFAAAFHDVGKPVACQHKWKEGRGDYKSFSGHEIVSARLWEDWAVENWSMLSDRFGFEPLDIYRVAYMIEFHKPWDIKKEDKLRDMALTLMRLDVEKAFENLVEADTWGRICDDMEEKRMKVIAWTSSLRNRCIALKGHSAHFEYKNPNGKPIMYVPIGASGSGKTTLYNTLGVLESFSLDVMRLELYGEPYADAFQKSMEDKHFRSTCNERFREILRRENDVFLDNTNTSKKNRRFYLTEARNRGYHLRAVLLPVSLRAVINRQKTRGDKNVPEEAVTRQYMGLQLPQYGEFDSVIVHDGNLK